MIERTIKSEILNALKSKPVTLLTGARQVGKSTLCYEIKKEMGYGYVSLDDRREREQAQKDPELFLSLHPWPLIIDEVQYAPALFDAMEAIVNKEKLENGKNEGMYLLTGSQAYGLMEGITESMAGRVAIVRMSPFSASEIFGKPENKFEIDLPQIARRVSDYKMDVHQLFHLIVRGMYPKLYDKPDSDASLFYSNYVDTYLEKDVSQIISLKNKLKFQNFMEMLASLTGEELVYDTLAKAIGVKTETIQSWISVLVAGDIVYLLQPYHENSVVKRVVKRPKIFFCDTGLACYLARLNNEDVLQRSIFSGRFVETYMVNEIRKSYQNHGVHSNLFYYRDTNQNEIDLVILDGGTLHLIECKSGVSYSKKDVRAFRMLTKSAYEFGTSALLCLTPSIYPLEKNIYALPVTSI